MGSYYKSAKFERGVNARIITALIVGLGVTDPTQVEKLANRDNFRCDTDYCIMTGSFHRGYDVSPRKATASWVHFRFDEPARACASDNFPDMFRLNPYSGKWNFMTFDDIANSPEYMASVLKKLNVRGILFI